MKARSSRSISLLLLVMLGAMVAADPYVDPALQAIPDVEGTKDIAAKASAIGEHDTPEETNARRHAQEVEGQWNVVRGKEPAPTRDAPNGDTLDAAVFLSELGERSMRCSACELVAEKMDDVIPLLVKTWPMRSSPERTRLLRATLLQRGCKQFDTMHVALMGDDGCAAKLL